MKLCRIGDIGSEKPAIIDKDNNYKDLSSVIKDLNSETLNFETLEKIYLFFVRIKKRTVKTL